MAVSKPALLLTLPGETEAISRPAASVARRLLHRPYGVSDPR